MLGKLETFFTQFTKETFLEEPNILMSDLITNDMNPEYHFNFLFLHKLAFEQTFTV